VQVSLALNELAKSYSNSSWQGGSVEYSVSQAKLMILQCVCYITKMKGIERAQMEV